MKFGLIGKSLSHSFSKTYFEEKFNQLQLDHYQYNNIEIDLLEEITKDLLNGYSGLNVTIPYKTEIISILDEIDDEAEKIGAVNTVKIYQDGKTKGFNTDAYGFKQSIKPFLEGSHNRALILGTGGASKAVKHVLKEYGIPYLFVSRQKGKSESIHWDDINENVMRFHPLIINTTPLGMFPNTETFPEIDYKSITPNHFLIDLVYNPEESLFLKKARSQGAKTLNGLSMLKHQAERSWDIWNSDQF